MVTQHRAAVTAFGVAFRSARMARASVGTRSAAKTTVNCRATLGLLPRGIEIEL
jgi:hypothetical protein